MKEVTFTNFSLFDGAQDKIQTQAWMTVDTQTGKITAVGQGTAPAEGESVDLQGQYVMPGLINCHTHICMDPQAGDGGTSANVVATTVRAMVNLHALLRSGVTYIRECGCSYDVDITLRQLQEKGELPQTPDIMPSGRPFSMTGGHGDFPNFGHLVDSPDEMRKAVRQGLKIGAQAVKMMATGGVMTPGDFMDDPQLSVAEMQTAVEEVHHKGKIIAAHAEGNPGIYNAIKAGVDSIEHGFYVNDEEIDMMLAQGTYLTPTLVAAWAIPEWGPGKLPDWEIKKAADAWEDLCRNVAHAWERGVKITLGTDAGTPFNDFSMTPVELELMVEQGAGSFAALQTSCQNSAQLMRIAGDYGTLEVGKQADFLTLQNDPLADVKAVQQADKGVYKAGVQVY
ncbi:amidohydrolase family protein [Lactobacillus sp. DCY120]|uniref:Amidohydrolase family protein n=1 Tax=Bombilactobacillus apium TaxID=2675299 RepID=A0A850R7L8_9LACO|nr:amidohydrolase family protein [Bombilactobacillus apium]NVY96672.1 amidohydrolase family protein [Bombilactobacillus apium]